MKTIRLAFASLLLALLVACSVTVDVSNPLDLDGRDVTLTPTETSTTLMAQALPFDFRGGLRFTFADQDIDARADSITNSIGLAGTATVAAPTTFSYPASFTIAELELSGTLSDSADSVSVSADAENVATFNRTGTCVGVTSCSYSLDTGINLNKATFSVGVDVIDIIRDGGENTLDLTVEADVDELIGAIQLFLTLDGEEGSGTGSLF